MSENTRKLVTIRTINNIQPIAGADMIVVATVDGWKVVVKNGEFKVGDPCVYFEIDSFLPEGDHPWKFLVDKSSQKFNAVVGHKLRTIKLKGQVSQGFVLPISALPIVQYVLGQKLDDPDAVLNSLNEDQKLNAMFLTEELASGAAALRDMDFSELLNIVKYDPPLSAELAGQAEGLFPSFIQKTDQERCQNLKSEIFGYENAETDFNYEALPQETLNKGVEEGRMCQVRTDDGVKYVILHSAKAGVDDRYEVTVKLDGSSMTAFVKNDDGDIKIGVCSRNLELKRNPENADNTFVRVLRDSGLAAALDIFMVETGRSIAVQGELMGPGIQNNRENFAKHVFYVFDIFDIDEQRKLDPQERKSVFDELNKNAKSVNPAGLKHTPIISNNFNMRENGIETIDDLLKFAEGPSINHPIREGLVFKRLDGKFSMKAISNLFLMKEK